MRKWPGITVLVLGAIIVGGGFGGSYYIGDLVQSEVPGALSMVKDNVAVVKPGVYGEYGDDILLGTLLAVNETLGGEEAIAYFVNGSTMSATIDMMVSGLAGAFFGDDESLAGNYWMNTLDLEIDVTDPYGLVIIKAPSNYTMMSLSLTTDMTDTILKGNATAGMPGISIADIGGMIPGSIAFLETYITAATMAGLGDPTMAVAVSTAYGGADFSTQLGAVAAYLNDYLANFVPTLIGLQAGVSDLPACTVATALGYIQMQWATKALIPAGLGSVSPEATGFEVGTAFSSFAVVSAAFGSLTSADDPALWYAAAEGNTENATHLKTTLGLTDDEFNNITEWYLGDFETLLKVGIEATLGIPGDDDVYLRLLLEQWQQNLLSEEDMDLGEGVTGLEMHLDEANLLDSDLNLELWDETNETSFCHAEGNAMWFTAVEAADGNDEYDTLKTIYGLNDVQMETIGAWLINLRDVTIPALGAATGALPTLPIWGTDITAARNDIGMYGPIGGGAIALLGIILAAAGKKK